jgi:hypothetical protein
MGAVPQEVDTWVNGVCRGVWKSCGWVPPLLPSM